jgi:Amelogenin
MDAIFSPQCELVAWLKPAEFIFDLSLRPVAFVKNGNAFSYPGRSWLGPVDVFTLLDRAGRPVAFNPSHAPRGQLPPIKPLKPLPPLKPLRPLRPLRPLKPLRPLTPLGGWSELSFQHWLSS